MKRRKRLEGSPTKEDNPDPQRVVDVVERYPDFFAKLPKDVLYMILYEQGLRIVDIIAFCGTSRQMRDICHPKDGKLEALWEDLYLEKVLLRYETRGLPKREVALIVARERNRPNTQFHIQRWRALCALLEDRYLLLQVTLLERRLAPTTDLENPPVIRVWKRDDLGTRGAVHLEIRNTPGWPTSWTALIEEEENNPNTPFGQEMVTLARRFRRDIQDTCFLEVPNYAAMAMAQDMMDIELPTIRMEGTPPQLACLLYDIYKAGIYQVETYDMNDGFRIESCVSCGAAAAAYLCGGCEEVRYCDAVCQERHWHAGGHKEECCAK
jgi:hypothetical protein